MKRIVLLILIGISLPMTQAKEVYTDNVVIVLDASGSMGDMMAGTHMVKMDAAKQALHQVLQQVPSSTHIGLLVFGAERKRGWLYPLGPRDDAQLTQVINSIRAKGGTPLGEYLKIGADRLLQARAEQYGYGSYRLLVVTDGEATDRDVMEQVAPLIMQRGVITLDVIGVSMRGRHTLATMAHSYRKADDPESLARAIKEVLAEASADDVGDDGSSVFDDIATLPASFASSVLTNLATTGNHPIGDRPKQNHSEPIIQNATPQTSHTPVSNRPVPVNVRVRKTPFCCCFGSSPIILIVAVGAILFAVIKSTKKRR